MTIINSVIIGGGSGDEVEAYALGDAKNAVKDDKVNLNHSANVLSSEEDISVVADGLTYISYGYITKDSVSFIGRYSWSSYTYLTTFKKVGDVWEERRTEDRYLGELVAKSPYGLFLSHSNAWKVVEGVLSPLEYKPSARSYEPKAAVQMSATGEYCAFATYTDSKYKVVVYYKNKPLKVLDEWSKTSQTYANCFFVRKNGVDYLFLDGGIPYSGSKNNYAYRLSPTGVEYLGVFTTTSDTSGVSHHYVGSVGDKDSVIFTTSNDDNIYLDSLNVLRADIDLSAKTCKLYYLSEEKASFISLLRDVYRVGSSSTLIFEPTGDANITQPFYNAIIKFDEETREFKPFLSKATLGNTVCYSADEKVLFELKDYSVKFSLYKTLLPFEQRYVASQPSIATYYKDQTLTGIVKENNNGVLKVSTVEDPNNPPPAVPDEAGLETTINYGSAEGVNGKVSGALTVSPEASVSGFYGYAGAVVRAKNPFVDYSGTINSFEIVIPATMTASDSNYHMLGYFGENSSGSVGLLVYYSGNWILRLKFEGDSNYTDIRTDYTAGLNTKVLVKVTYDSSTGYTFWLSSNDGGSWSRMASTTTTRLISRLGDFVIGGETSSTDGWRGSIDFKGLYVKINNEEVYNGIAPVFGSVQVGYGYFKNTYFYPLGGQASKDKYVPYEGGLLTEDNIYGRKATTMNIILSRNADMGSWTSDTKGYLSAQDGVVMGVSKKLPTPVYLWHDLSYITPVVPETLEPDVTLTSGGVKANVTVVGSPTISNGIVSGFDVNNYVLIGKAYKTSGSAKYVFRFTTPSSLANEPIAHCEYYFEVACNASGMLKAYSWGGAGDNMILQLETNTTYEVTIDLSGTTKTITAVKVGTEVSGTTTFTDSSMDASADYNICLGRYSTGASGGFNGSIDLANSYIEIDGVRVWTGAVQDSGTVSLPASWKTLDGVVYEYPDGFPETQASDLLDDNAVREGSNNLYVTKTGDSCDLVISTSPYGVDSSAVIGTVELDANGGITSYTPGE